MHRQRSIREIILKSQAQLLQLLLPGSVYWKYQFSSTDLIRRMKDIQTFDREQANNLMALLGKESRIKNHMSYHEAAGFLFVVACAPEVVNPREWLTVVLSEADETSDEAISQTMEGLISLYNELNRQIQEADTALLPGCDFRETPMQNFEESAPIHLWSKGFVMGFSWLSNMWTEYVPDQLSEELTANQMVLTYFTSRDLAEEFLHEETNNKDITIEKMAADMQRLFPDAMKSFAFLGHSIQQVLAERPDPPEPARRGKKIGRNEPCHCGSGKKYKKCCG